MRLHFFTIPVFDGEAATAQLNQLLSTHRVVAVERQFVADGTRSLWSICVTTTAAADVPPPQASTTKKTARVDYKQVLPPEQFAVFAKLRALRKSIAEADGVPPYAVFNNAQLAEKVTRPARSIAQIAAIEGVGPSRVKKYGQRFLDALTASPPATEATDAPTQPT